MRADRTNIGKTILATIAASLAMSCGGANYFAPMSVKTTDDAIFEDIKKLADQQSWDAAIARFGELSSSFRGSYEVVKVEAGVHAGKCGLNFLDFTSSIGGSSAPFGMFMSGFTDVSVDAAECQTAQDVIDGNFGNTAALRTANLGTTKANNVNFFMAVLGMAKIGTQLREKADTNQDGSVDGGFDACAAGSITDAEIVRLGTGFALLMDNFTTIAATLSSGSSALISGLNAQCALLVPNPCTVTDDGNAAWADANIIKAFRSLTNSSALGIQTCTTGMPNPFLCCP